MILHRSTKLSGRDPREAHRASTPLELLFDLTFVVAFSIAGNAFAHGLVEGHFVSALAAFALAIFAVCWSWINFSWYASAYDTDDWLHRVLTMVQMLGVVVFALGIPDMFKSVDAGGLFEGRVMVMGYVIMRLALLLLWMRVAKHDAQRRPTALIYAATLFVSQAIWVILAFSRVLSVPAFFAALTIPFALELLGPILAERKGGTPWHPHHIAERYGLLAIIALGEGVVGTVASVSAAIEKFGWNADALLICAAGIGLTFCMWWIYFAVPFGALLERNRNKAFYWGYSHILLYGAIAAMGSGLHAAGYYLEQKSTLTATQTLLTVAIPVALFVGLVFAIYAGFSKSTDPSHKWQLAAAAVLGAAALAASMLGVSLVYCLLLLVLAPFAIVIGYEWKGHRHIAAELESHGGN